MVELICLRHGETEWNVTKRLQGHTDIALNARGQGWACDHRIPEPYAGWHWYVSPLQRAQQTAAGLGLRAEVADQLIEMNFGLWEGRTIKALRAADPVAFTCNEERGLDLEPPKGETPRQVQTRLLAWLSQLPPGRYGAICHKGVMRALLAEALDWPMLGKCPVKIDWQALQHFRWSSETGLELYQANIMLEHRSASQADLHG